MSSSSLVLENIILFNILLYTYPLLTQPRDRSEPEFVNLNPACRAVTTNLFVVPARQAP